MKRAHYAIEGDLIDVGVIDYNERYVYMKPEMITVPVLRESLFSVLPIEVTCHLMSYVARSENPHDLRNFLTFLLPLFGISLKKLRQHYDEPQRVILTSAETMLQASYPDLFEVCINERIARFSLSTWRTSMDHSAHKRLKTALLIAVTPFTEVFAFLSYLLCECCTQSLAFVHCTNGSSAVPLCNKCNKSIEKPTTLVSFKNIKKILNLDRIAQKPHRAYRWIPEKKVYQWCCLEKSLPIPFKVRSIQRASIQGNPQMCYLLKDIMPYVKKRYFA